MNKKAPSRRGSAENFLAWESGVALMTNPFILYDLLVFSGVAWFFPSVVISIGISWLEPPTDPAMVFSIFKLVATIIVIFLLAFFAIGLVLLRNRFYCRYVLNGTGVSCETARGASPKANLTTWAHFFSISPWSIPEGAVEGYGKGKWVEWDRVRGLVVHRRLRVISLTAGVLPIQRLYCKDEATFVAALAICQDELAHREAVRAEKTSSERSKATPK